MTGRSEEKSHEAILAAFFLGEGSAEDPAVRKALEQEGLGPDDVEELRSVVRELEHADRYERDLLAEAADAAGSPPEQDVLATLRRLQREGARPETATPPQPVPVARRNPIPALVLAAAAIVLVAWLGGLFESEPRREIPSSGNTFLGREEIVLTSPTVMEKYDVLTWEGSRPADGYFECLVYHGETPSDEPLSRSGKLLEPRWELPQDAETWPPTITLEIRSRTATVQHGFGRATVHRKP